MNVHAPAVEALYDDGYAARYPELYLHPWPDKHRVNLEVIESLRAALTRPDRRPSWLDLACGQAWHFSQVDGFRTKVGVDLSPAQLLRARAANPDASLVRADIAGPVVRRGSFDLVTNFWAGYSYLPGEQSIRTFVANGIDAVAPGGAMYVEVLPADSLPAFNSSDFAAETGFRVAQDGHGSGRWSFADTGGVHEMVAVDVDVFLEACRPMFGHVEARHDGGFMWHVVGVGRLDEPVR